MVKTKGHGVMPAAMTIWNPDESFNQKETERYLHWLIDKGAHGIAICGSTGENIAMRFEEQKHIIEVLDQVHWRRRSCLRRDRPLYHGRNNRTEPARTKMRR